MSKRLDEMDALKRAADDVPMDESSLFQDEFAEAVYAAYPAMAALIKAVEAFIDIFDNGEAGVTVAYGAMKEARRKFEEGL